MLSEVWALLQENFEVVYPTPSSDGKFLKAKVSKKDEHTKLIAKRVQITYGHRRTKPVYSILTYEDSEGGGRGMGYLPLSNVTLLLWCFQYDPKDPHAPLPTEDKKILPITSFFPKRVSPTKPEGEGR